MHVVCHTLFLSDVYLAGLGHRELPPGYSRLEPNVYVDYGSFAYSVQTSYTNATPSNVLSVWPYKYATTSVGLCAMAQHYGLASWPSCMHLSSRCVGNELPQRQTTAMLDELAGQIQTKRVTAVAVQHRWFDRLHHFVLPSVFNPPGSKPQQCRFHDRTETTAPSCARRCTAIDLCSARCRGETANPCAHHRLSGTAPISVTWLVRWQRGSRSWPGLFPTPHSTSVLWKALTTTVKAAEGSLVASTSTLCLSFEFATVHRRSTRRAMPALRPRSWTTSAPIT
ncbi:TPA: hypothetical protein N0F65_004475 [Lagenidium giganteum]|uniref:Uncharacterized protein n=1 Tax=Lagenidium giganteum TaxID=4803 RepID=A0AAV2ZCT5_9STRA|nr:TPA: hypothetical protein N0F65_004475 [Lagenidium giganteum]